MRIYAKHLLRTLRRAPLQPLLILLTVALSVAVTVTAVRLPSVFSERSREISMANSYLGDLLVTPRGDSGLRWILGDDAAAAVGNEGTVCGEFRLTGFTTVDETTQILQVSAVDLPAANSFYSLQYLSYGGFTAENLRTSAILSEHCANALGVSRGDSVSIRLLEETFTFTVQAVAKADGILTDADLLIASDCIRATLAARVPAVSALGDSCPIYTRLMVNAAEGVDPAALALRLSESGALSDYAVTVTGAERQFSFIAITQALAIWIPVVLLTILAAYLIMTSLKLLRQDRSAEYALFSICGAPPRLLGRLQYAEGLLYGILGGPAGILLSLPLLRASQVLFFWREEPVSLTLLPVVCGLLWAPVLITVCTFLHLRQQPQALSERLRASESAEETARPRNALPPLLLIALLIPITALTPPRQRIILASALLLAAVWLFAAASSHLIRWMARLAEWGLSRFRKVYPPLLLSVKQLKNSFALRHVGRIAVLAIALSVSISTAAKVLSAQGDLLDHAFLSPVVGINVDVLTEEKLREHPAVEHLSRISFQGNVELENGVNVFGISVKTPEGCLHEELIPEVLPNGSEAVITESIASLMELEAGDTFPVTIQGIERDLTVSHVYAGAVPLLYFDTAAFGIADEQLCISPRADLSKTSPEYASLLALLEENGCELVDSNTVLRDMPRSFEAFSLLLNSASVMAIVLAVIGLANSLAEQYRRRRNDRLILRMNGMAGASLLILQLLEILLLLICSLLLALPFASAIVYLIDVGVHSFGISLLL